MKTNKQIRQAAREAIRGNRTAGAVTQLISLSFAIAIVLATSIVQIGFGYKNDNFVILLLRYGLNVFLILPLNFGICKIFLEMNGRQRPLSIEGIFTAFSRKYYFKSIEALFMQGLFTFLWSLLLIIPGIIKSLSYAMTPYILADHSDEYVIGDEAIDISMEMMKGHKTDLFLITLGYIGWCILSIFTLGIALFWIVPYYHAVYAQFYLALKEDAQSQTFSIS